MAAVATILEDIPLGGTRHLYRGTIAMDSSYPTGGEALDPSANTRFDFLLAKGGGAAASGLGYQFEWDAANQKLVATYGDNNNASDGPLIEVPNATDLSAQTAIPFIAIGA